jgi:hypothetical protein
MLNLAADFRANDLARNNDFDATVFLPASGGTIVGNRASLAKSL